jgi:hypothetical protein
MYKVKLLTALLISLALLCASAALAAPTWPPPSGWVPLPGMNDVPNDKGDTGPYGTVPKNLDLVGNTPDNLSGGFYGFDTSYMYFRMRLDSPDIATEWGYGNELFIFIDRPGYYSVGTEEEQYAPDFALKFTRPRLNDATRDSLELIYLDPSPAQHKWFWLEEAGVRDIADFGVVMTPGQDPAWTYDPNSNDYVADDDSFVDLAIGWDALAAASSYRYTLVDGVYTPTPTTTPGLDYQQSWYINYGTNDPIDDGPTSYTIYSDLGANERAQESEQFNSWEDYATPAVTTPEPASMALTLLAVGFAGGVARRRKTKNEAGREE